MNRIANGELRDVVPRVQQGVLCFKNVTKLYGCHVDVTLFTPVRKLQPFAL